MRKLVLPLLFWSGAALAAPAGLAPGVTDKTQAEAQLKAPVPGASHPARLRYNAPPGAAYSSVEVYYGRQTQVAELIEYRYEPGADPAPLRASLGKPSFSYAPAAGGAAEVYVEARAVLLLGADGKARGVGYLSASALAALYEMYPQKADRSAPEKAITGLIAALASNREAELKSAASTSMPAEDASSTDPKTGKTLTTQGLSGLKAQRRALLALLEGAKVDPLKAKPGAAEVAVTVRHPVFGAGSFGFVKEGDQWLLKSFPTLRGDRSGKTAWSAVLLAAESAAPTAKSKPAAEVSGPLSAAWGDSWGTPLAAALPVASSLTDAGDVAQLWVSDGTKHARLTAKKDAKGTWTLTSAEALGSLP